jgi:hypothetical protein
MKNPVHCITHLRLFICKIKCQIQAYTGLTNSPLAVPWFNAFPKERIVCITRLSLTEFLTWPNNIMHERYALTTAERRSVEDISIDCNVPLPRQH